LGFTFFQQLIDNIFPRLACVLGFTFCFQQLIDNFFIFGSKKVACVLVLPLCRAALPRSHTPIYSPPPSVNGT
jgi:hypothetical protein